MRFLCGGVGIPCNRLGCAVCNRHKWNSQLRINPADCDCGRCVMLRRRGDA